MQDENSGNIKTHHTYDISIFDMKAGAVYIREKRKQYRTPSFFKYEDNAVYIYSPRSGFWEIARNVLCHEYFCEVPGPVCADKLNFQDAVENWDGAKR